MPETQEILGKLEKDMEVLKDLIASGTYLQGELVNKDQAIQVGRYLGIRSILDITYEDLYGDG